MSRTGTPYDEQFFAAIDPESRASAQTVLPLVLDLVEPASAIDVGCGSGAWSRTLLDLGVDDVVGVDGPYVPPEHRVDAFVENDLRRPLRIDRRFDLALCLEVGEHLPHERAAGLVDDLVRLAPVVLFSAAVPGQGGTDHVNERWPEHWVSLFEAQGWRCWDALRPWIRSEPSVAWWYRQNLFLAAAPGRDHQFRRFPRLSGTRLVHPVDYLGPLPGAGHPPSPAGAAAEPLPASSGAATPALEPAAPTLRDAARVARTALRHRWRAVVDRTTT